MTMTDRLLMIKKACIKDMNECNKQLAVLKPLVNSQQFAFWNGKLQEARRMYNMVKGE